MRIATSVILAATVSLVSCGSSKDAQTTASNPGELTFTTGDFDIAAGDSFECFYTDTKTPSDKVWGVVGAVSHQMPGGHHVVAYYTDVPRAPQHHPCVDSEMVNWHQVAGGDESGSSSQGLAMPAGYAYKIPPGKQLVIQTHYINTTGKTRTVNDSITLQLRDESQVKVWANQIVYSDEAWTLPAKKGGTQSTTTCTIKKDLNAFMLLGHMHELGKHYKLEKLDAAGNPVDVVYETDWAASYSSHPPIKRWDPATPYVLKAGTKLRQTCTWDNETDADVIFPREMCVFFGFYYPDQGEMFCE